MTTATSSTTARTIPDMTLRLRVEKEARQFEYFIIDEKKKTLRLYRTGQRAGVKLSLRPEQKQGHAQQVCYAWEIEDIRGNVGNNRQLFCLPAPRVTLDDLVATVRAAMSAPTDAPASTEAHADAQPAGGEAPQAPDAHEPAQTPDPVDWSAFKRRYCRKSARWLDAARVARARADRWALVEVVMDAAKTIAVARAYGAHTFDRTTGGYDYIDPVTAEVTPF